MLWSNCPEPILVRTVSFHNPILRQVIFIARWSVDQKRRYLLRSATAYLCWSRGTPIEDA